MTKYTPERRILGNRTTVLSLGCRSTAGWGWIANKAEDWHRCRVQESIGSGIKNQGNNLYRDALIHKNHTNIGWWIRRWQTNRYRSCIWWTIGEIIRCRGGRRRGIWMVGMRSIKVVGKNNLWMIRNNVEIIEMGSVPTRERAVQSWGLTKSRICHASLLSSRLRISIGTKTSFQTIKSNSHNLMVRMSWTSWHASTIVTKAINR